MEKRTNNEPLISVIIPVYNVENYIFDCLTSVVNQSYRQLQIIVVDDGSTDNSGQICEQFAEKDSRITVIHKENEGQATARNEGLKISDGEYISFIDSDDVIEKDFIRVLYEIIISTESDISFCYFDSDASLDNYSNDICKNDIIINYCTAIDFLKNIVNGDGFQAENAVWNKLYKKECIRDVIFENMKYEDVMYTTKTICKAKKIAYCDLVLYHYRIRKDSTTNKDKYRVDKEQVTDQLFAKREQIDYFVKNDYLDLEAIYKSAYYFEFLYYYAMTDNPEWRNYIKESILYVKPNYYQLKLSNQRQKYLFRTFPFLFVFWHKIKKLSRFKNDNY